MAKNASRKVSRKHGELHLISNNYAAMTEGPQKKKWTKHDIKAIKPLTDNQKTMFHRFGQGYNICAHGSAGTGKTFLALYLAMCDLLDGNNSYHNLKIVRSAVPTRDIGFMPGNEGEKVSFYERPYNDIFADLFGRPSTYNDMKDVGLVQFVTTSFIRGLTWDDSIIVVDEGQNMSWHEIYSVVTRIGTNTKIIFTGDLPQTDLNKRNETSGMARFLETAALMPDYFTSIQFTPEDNVRSDFSRAFIMAAEKTQR